jgi:hypothetical protein
MFLLPQPSASGGASGSENVLIIHWTFSSPNKTTLGIELAPPNNMPETVWSNDYEAVAPICATFSKASDVSNACHLVLPMEPQDLDGMLVIEEPKSGVWKLAIRNGDSVSHTNAGDEQPVDFLLTVIGKDTVTVPVNKLDPDVSPDSSSRNG